MLPLSRRNGVAATSRMRGLSVATLPFHAEREEVLAADLRFNPDGGLLVVAESRTILVVHRVMALSVSQIRVDVDPGHLCLSLLQDESVGPV